MKPTRQMNYFKFLAIVVFALVTSVSCKDDDDKKNTDYVGTWARTETLVIEEIEIQVQDLMIFTENTVTNLGRAWDPENEEWIDLLSMEADIDVSGNEMDVTVTEIGISDVDEDGIPTGSMMYFTEDDLEFEFVLEEVDLEKNFIAEYSVSGEELTLSMDGNDDGDFDDEGETSVYFRE